MKLRHPLLAVVFALATVPTTWAAQPHMQAALTNLLQARENLQRATADKGGHRVKALKAVDAAIAEVKAGIEYDRTHASPDEKAKK